MKTGFQQGNNGPLYEREILSYAYVVDKRGPFRKSYIQWVSVRPEALRLIGVNEKP